MHLVMLIKSLVGLASSEGSRPDLARGALIQSYGPTYVLAVKNAQSLPPLPASSHRGLVYGEHIWKRFQSVGRTARHAVAPL